MNFYTGIGSRETPIHILAEMTNLARNLELCGWTLRSGGAKGADSAFEAGVSDPHNAKIYLPWQRFAHNPSGLFHISPEAYAMAESFHPAWNRCGIAARKFHARNCYQVLGADLNTPSRMVICWTPGGKVAGGTGQAMRIAKHYNIPIFNLALPEDDRPMNNFIEDTSAELLRIMRSPEIESSTEKAS
jgi:hypothetical protein